MRYMICPHCKTFFSPKGKAIELRKKGYSKYKISKILGLPETTVGAWIRKNESSC